MTAKTTEQIAGYALDLVIVVSLTVLAAIGRLDSMVVVGVLGPLLGARVASLGGKKKDGGGEGPSLPPSATLLLLAGVAKLLSRSSSTA